LGAASVLLALRRDGSSALEIGRLASADCLEEPGLEAVAVGIEHG